MSTEWTDEQLIEIIRRALQAHDWQAVASGLRVLAVQSPRDAEVIHEAIQIVTAR